MKPWDTKNNAWDDLTYAHPVHGTNSCGMPGCNTKSVTGFVFCEGHKLTEHPPGAYAEAWAILQEGPGIRATWKVVRL